MRISTSTLFEQGVASISQQNSDLFRLQQQIASGRRVLTPSDDPIAAARAVEVSQSQAVNDQYLVNGQRAQGTLELQEAILSQATELLQDVRTIAVNAGNPALSDANRASLAVDVRSRFEQLLGLANSTDGNGQYLFSGYKGMTQPFVETAPGSVAYNGDQGRRLVQIGPNRQVNVSSPGAEVFQLIRNGNGTFVAAAEATNAGTGVVSAGVVLDPAAFAASSGDFTITFTSATSFDLTDNGPPPVTTSLPYTSGAAIDLPGAQISISGQPEAGDSFTVRASSTDQDIFSTIAALVSALETPATGAAGNARLTNDLNSALSNLDLALDKVLSVRAEYGATLREVESTRNVAEDLALQYSSRLSELQDLDYAKAISEFSLKQVSLEAAQQTFLRVQGLSLFNYLS